MITYKEYRNGRCDLYTFCRQLYREDFKNYVESFIGRDNILNSKDKYFNDIPIKKWDSLVDINLGFFSWIIKNNEELGIPLTQSMCVCIAKAMADIVYEEHHYAVIYLTTLNGKVVKKIPYKKKHEVETLIKWAKNKWKKNKDYKVSVYRNRTLIFSIMKG